MAVLSIVAALVAGFMSWYVYRTIEVYNQARKLGLPIVITPVEPMLHPLWAIVVMALSPFIRRLPYRLGEFVDFDKFQHKNGPHKRLGPIFLVVNTSGIKIMLDDGPASEDMLSRYKEFVKPDFLYKVLDIFGPNVDSANGEEWQRHRKITAPPFNERNSKLVWMESLVQASGMLRKWTAQGNSKIASTHIDTTTLTLHVITAAGFGRKVQFDDVSKPGPGHVMSFKDAMQIVLMRLVAVILTSSLSTRITKYIPDILNPVASVEVATKEFKRYLVEMVDEERASLGNKTQDQDTLVSALLRAANLGESQGKGKNTLSNEEIYGNLFIYSFAGHDTTAGTLHYAITLLAADETRQAWLKEEIRAVVGTRGGLGGCEYGDTFPRLKRCLAVMFETLRLYGPVTTLPRTTGNASLSLKVKGEEYSFPPNTLFMANLVAMHSKPEVWGEDSFTWKPERWIAKTDGLEGLENEELVPPPPGFIPWATGARVCPGKKFAQVEFVAVIAKLFGQNHVKVARLPGETNKQVDERVHEALLDSVVLVTLKMKYPEKVQLLWEVDE